MYDEGHKVDSVYPIAGGTSRTGITGSWVVVNSFHNDNTILGRCPTPSETAAKTVDYHGFKLKNPCYLEVLICYSNTSASALTLNVEGTGAKPIYINNVASSATNYTLPQGTYFVYYDGTNYQFRTDGFIPGYSSSSANILHSATTTGNWRKLLLGHDYTNSNTAPSSGFYEAVYEGTDISAQPSTGTLRSTKYNVNDKVTLSYDTTNECLNFTFL